MKRKQKHLLKKRRPKDKNFDREENSRLIAAQHSIHRIFRALVKKNGTKPYIKSFDRRDKVVQHYLEKYELIGTSVESFWRPTGACILIGKDW
jgi:hypothetical protein